MSKYTYTKTIDSDRLTQEIQNSSITVALDHITTVGSSVDVFFKADLSTEEVTTLDGIISSHVPAPLVQISRVIVDNTITAEPLPPKNLHCMEPWGCIGDSFQPRGETKYVCSITLSNKSTDGLTFNYNTDIEIVPSIGNYVFQKRGTKKTWVTSVDTEAHTVTFELPVLVEGGGIYSVGMYVDAEVKNWSPIMYVWGLTASIFEYENGILEETPCKDLVECAVVDITDKWLNDDFCLATLGVTADDPMKDAILIANKWEQNGEYGHWTKYYDESWVCNCNRIYVPGTDGSPGGLFPGWILRLSLFTTEINENKIYDVLLDYKPTSIPEGSA